MSLRVAFWEVRSTCCCIIFAQKDVFYICDGHLLILAHLEIGLAFMHASSQHRFTLTTLYLPLNPSLLSNAISLICFGLWRKRIFNPKLVKLAIFRVQSFGKDWFPVACSKAIFQLRSDFTYSSVMRRETVGAWHSAIWVDGGTSPLRIVK